MMDWCRLWHDMPTDPKFRTVARVSGQPLSAVIAIFTFMLTDASANAAERGVTQCDDETVASALDLSDDVVTAVRAAMQGRVLDGERLTGWEKRQPLREDNSAERTRAYRERKKLEKATERSVTQCDAPEKIREDTDKSISPLVPPSGGRKASRIGKDWVPSEADEAFAKSQGFSDQQIRSLADQFRDHWLGESGKKAAKVDWAATWRNWCRRDVDWNGPPGTRGRPRGEVAPENDPLLREWLTDEPALTH